MIRYQKLRLAAACASIAIAIGTSAAAAAQAADQSNVYLLRVAREVADGRAVTSTSHDMLVGRARSGDRSLMLHDLQAGAITIERRDGTGAIPLRSRRRIDSSQAYDYRARRMSGTGPAVAIFNTYLRPLIAQGPALGQNTSWSVPTSLAALGLEGQPAAPLTMTLRRTYLTNAGQPVVLIEFDIPAFSYRAPNGDTVVHWARGFAVTDPSFSEIHALGTQHRATVTGANGEMLPVSVRTSLHGIDRDGGWRMSFADAPVIRAAVDRSLATAGDRILPVTPESDSAPIQPFPALVAARLDLAALAIGENGANPLPSTYDAGLMGAPDIMPGPVNPREDRAAAIEEAERDPFLIMQPSETSPRRVIRTVRRQNDTPAPTAEDLARATAAMERGARAAAEQQNDTSIRNQMLNGLSNYVQNDYSQMQLNPEDKAFTYRTAEPPPSTITRSERTTPVDQRIGGGSGILGDPYLFRPPPESPDSTPTSTEIRRIRVIRRDDANVTGNGTLPQEAFDRQRLLLERLAPISTAAQYQVVEPSDPTGEISPRNRMLQGLNTYIQNDYSQMRLNPDDRAFTYRTAEARNIATIAATRERGGQGTEVDPAGEAAMERARLDSIVRDMARQAEVDRQRENARVRTTPVDSTDPGPPPWMTEEWRQEPNRRPAEDTEYRLLLARMEREQAEARRDERRRQQREESGIDSLDTFVRNNAFDYTSMVGIVATDLSRWADWLATQNVRELERLARLIGYPNLASALADAQNLIRYAGDEGYRRWSMQAPSCGGLIGCGPSYLERWWARQATVLLGDILADSRDIFSTAGFTDIGISGVNLSYLLRDNALQDGDIVDVRISQFGRVLFQGRTNLTNLGERYSQLLRQGVASLEIFAVNEGSSPPNTAEIRLDNVVRGQGTQSYSLRTGETATLRIETNARGQ